MTIYDIASRGKTTYNMASIRPPPGTNVLSIDRGVVHAQLQGNGMHLIVVPTGTSNSVMMRRVCVGGSRLEDPSCAGAAHVIEHMDFRSLDWNNFSGMNKNAATSKTYIAHEANMLLDPQFGHLKKELAFQKQTMLGDNLNGLSDRAIYNEIRNVRDEGNFNSQVGSGFRAVVMEMEKMLLSRVWSQNANTLPTIGTNTGLSNLKTAKDMLRMHHMFRTPSRTYMVMCGPVDVNRTLHLLHNTFHDIPRRHDDLLRAIPTSVTPAPMRPSYSSISLDSGNRFVAIGGLNGAYSADTDVMQVMQHLVGMLGAQPAVQQNGLSDVSLYMEPTKETSVFSLVAKVTSDGPEVPAMARAHAVLEQCVINPLVTFQDDQILSQLLTQYRASVHEALQSGPQQCAALAVQGILACDNAALAWHVDDRFDNRCINAAQIRRVAQNMFHPQYLGVVHCTAHSAPRPQMALEAYSQGRHAPYHINLVPSTQHLAPPIAVTNVCEYVPVSRLRSLHNKETVYDNSRARIGSIAYNVVPVQPLGKRALVCALGTPDEYGGWAKASLTVAAMNVLAKMAQCHNCKYALENQQLTATIEANVVQPTIVQPLLTSLGLGLAVTSSSIAPTPEVMQLRQLLPSQALQMAIQDAEAYYSTPSQLAMAQARSQTCDVNDAGFMPNSLASATRLLSAEHMFVDKYVHTLCMKAPMLAGTNIGSTHLHGIANQIHRLQKSVPAMPAMPAIPSQDDFIFHTAPKLEVVHKMGGLHTFPYVASVRGRSALTRQDRAALLVSNQIMVGGMGAQYTHDIRQRGVSYRPNGGMELTWQQNPVLTLHATFDARVKDVGQTVTRNNIAKWSNGDASVFTPQAVNQAKQAIQQQVLLTAMEFSAQKYTLLANLDKQKFSTQEILKAVHRVQATDPPLALHKYFGQQPTIYESWVV